jgi:hypothetical protein
MDSPRGPHVTEPFLTQSSQHDLNCSGIDPCRRHTTRLHANPNVNYQVKHQRGLTRFCHLPFSNSQQFKRNVAMPSRYCVLASQQPRRRCIEAAPFFCRTVICGFRHLGNFDHRPNGPKPDEASRTLLQLASPSGPPISSHRITNIADITKPKIAAQSRARAPTPLCKSDAWIGPSPPCKSLACLPPFAPAPVCKFVARWNHIPPNPYRFSIISKCRKMSSSASCG